MNLDKLFKLCDTLINDFEVVSCLVANGAATRGDIVRLTSVKRTTAHESLERLYTKGLVKKKPCSVAGGDLASAGL